MRLDKPVIWWKSSEVAPRPGLAAGSQGAGIVDHIAYRLPNDTHFGPVTLKVSDPKAALAVWHDIAGLFVIDRCGQLSLVVTASSTRSTICGWFLVSRGYKFGALLISERVKTQFIPLIKCS